MRNSTLLPSLSVSLVAAALAGCSGGEGTGPGPCDGGDCVDADAPEGCGPDSCPEADTVCVDLEGGGFRCECRPGTRREDGVCRPPSVCEEASCSGHGTCSDETGEVLCECDEGWGGPTCGECGEGYHDDSAGGCTDDPCTPDPCPPERRCVPDGGLAECACPAGRHDEGGECVPDTTCLETTCNGHGTCSESGGRLSCACDEGWAGVYCDECDAGAGYHDDGAGGCTTDPCVPSPCDEPHESVCEVDELGEAVCRCDPGFHRELELCVPDETCGGETCSGHGACSVVDGRTSCACEDGYVGDACEGCDEAAGYHDDGAGGCTDDPCTPEPCDEPHQTVCVDLGGGRHRCDCDAGYHPDGALGCTDDPCVPDPCAATGEACRDDGSGGAECYTPVCDDGNPCTTDEFVGGACRFTPVSDLTPCSTTLCIADEACAAGRCGGGTPVTCDDGDPCTDDSCDALTGCDNVVDPTNVPDDGLACTVDSCASGAATHTSSDGLCDDGLWCTGEERCLPAAADADGRGCVVRDVPAPPGPSTTCSEQVCREGTHDFEVSAAAAGTPCDDRIACTTSDRCDGTGACVGTVTLSCYEGGTCSPSVADGDIEVSPARLTGHVTYAGGFPAHSPSQTSISIYLRSQATGVSQIIESVSFGSWDGTGYPLASYSARDDRVIDVGVEPGVYDVVYRRWEGSAGDRISYNYPDDPYAAGHVALREDVVIGPGTNLFDVDITPVRLSGALLFAGGFPPTSPSQTSISIYLRPRSTGTPQILESVSFGSWDGTGYPLASYSARDDRAVYLAVLPGTYDVMYRRWEGSAGDRISYNYPTDPYAAGWTAIREGVTVAGAAASLDVDITPVRLSGALLFSGGFPPTSPSQTSISIYLRPRSTGTPQILESVSFGSWDGTGYPLASYSARDDRVVDLAVLPGTYDVMYRRWEGSASDRISYNYPGDSYAAGWAALREGVAVAGAAASLDVDITPVRLHGSLLFTGGFPPTSPSQTSISIYLRPRSTGTPQILESVSFGSWDGTGYPLASYSARDDRAVDLAVLPGTYDVMYRRWEGSADDRISYNYPGDPYAAGWTALVEGRALSGASTSLDVDLTPVRLTGSLLFDGGFPPRSPSQTSIGIYLRPPSTGTPQILESVSFGSWDGAGYPLASYSARDDRAVDLAVLPGTYDVMYRRWEGSASDRISYNYPGDPYGAGWAALVEDRALSGASATLDVDLTPERLTGALTYAGGFPPTSPSQTSIGIYLRPRSTGLTQILESVSFGSWDGTGYPLASYSARDDRVVDLAVLPGTYDILYRRWEGSAGDRISYFYPTDPYAGGYTSLADCTLVP